jgi:hypothetical protein
MLIRWPCSLCDCASVYHNFFVFYAIRVVWKESWRLVLPRNSFNIILTTEESRDLPSDLYLSDFWQKFCVHFSSFPTMQHASSISSDLSTIIILVNLFPLEDFNITHLKMPSYLKRLICKSFQEIFLCIIYLLYPCYMDLQFLISPPE